MMFTTIPKIKCSNVLYHHWTWTLLFICTIWCSSVLGGVRLCSLVFICARWCSSVLAGVHLCSLVFVCTRWSSSVLASVRLYSLVFICTRWCSAVLAGARLYALLLLCTRCVLTAVTLYSMVFVCSHCCSSFISLPEREIHSCDFWKNSQVKHERRIPLQKRIWSSLWHSKLILRVAMIYLAIATVANCFREQSCPSFLELISYQFMLESSIDSSSNTWDTKILCGLRSSESNEILLNK